MSDLVLPVPIEKQISVILPTDEDPEATGLVTFRQATTREIGLVDDLISNGRVYTMGSAGVNGVRNPITLLSIRRYEVFLTMTDCSIKTNSAKGGDLVSLFTFKTKGTRTQTDLNEAQFNDRWGDLPAEWANAIIDAMLQVNPQWNPEQAGE